MDQDFSTWITLSRTRDAIWRAREKELSKSGIEVQQSSILVLIEALGNEATPREIAKWAFREPHSISNMLKRMERDGLVQRTRDSNRKNVLRIKLTDKGSRTLQEVQERHSVHNIMSALSKEEHQQLRTLLEALWNKSLEQLGMNLRSVFPTKNNAV